MPAIEEILDRFQVISGSTGPDVLKRTLDLIKYGYSPVSMPELIAAKAEAPPGHPILLEPLLLTHSEEHVIYDREGLFAEKGRKVVLALHGAGIWTPERWETRDDESVSWYARYREEQEALLQGVLPSGQIVPIYSIEEMEYMENADLHLPYAIAMPHEIAAQSPPSPRMSEWVNDGLIVLRAGGGFDLDTYFRRMVSQLEEEGGEKSLRLRIQNAHPYAESAPEYPTLLALGKGDLGFLSPGHHPDIDPLFREKEYVIPKMLVVK